MKSFEQLYDKNGHYITDSKYKEIHVLDRLLTEEKIPHTIKKYMDGFQICYPVEGPGMVMDAIEHFGSYGNEDDLLEIMGLLTAEEEADDSVLGNLTAKDVFKRIKQHWDTRK